MKLLDYGFERFENLRIIEQGVAFGSVRVEEGVVGEINAVASANLDVVVPKDEEEYLEKVVSMERQITAPIVKGQPIGRITVKIKGKVVGNADLVCDRDVNRVPNYILWEKRLFCR
jgi:D-alanyl-D-alanine carboxypeptidase (penicillin-binding protein 5/6)